MHKTYEIEADTLNNAIGKLHGYLCMNDANCFSVKLRSIRLRVRPVTLQTFVFDVFVFSKE